MTITELRKRIAQQDSTVDVAAEVSADNAVECPECGSTRVRTAETVDFNGNVLATDTGCKDCGWFVRAEAK